MSIVSFRGSGLEHCFFFFFRGSRLEHCVLEVQGLYTGLGEQGVIDQASVVFDRADTLGRLCGGLRHRSSEKLRLLRGALVFFRVSGLIHCFGGCVGGLHSFSEVQG